MSKNINDLRDALFATLAAVRDGSIDLDKARAVNELGKTIIDTARVEVEYLRATDGGESPFLAGGAAGLPHGITTSVIHRLVG